MRGKKKTPHTHKRPQPPSLPTYPLQDTYECSKKKNLWTSGRGAQYRAVGGGVRVMTTEPKEFVGGSDGIGRYGPSSFLLLLLLLPTEHFFCCAILWTPDWDCSAHFSKKKKTKKKKTDLGRALTPERGVPAEVRRRKWARIMRWTGLYTVVAAT